MEAIKKKISDFLKKIDPVQWFILTIVLAYLLCTSLWQVKELRNDLKESRLESEAWQALATHTVRELTKHCIEEQKLGDSPFSSSHYIECDGLTISDQDVLYLVHEQVRYSGFWIVSYNVMRGGYDLRVYNDSLTPISPSSP